MNTYLRDRWLRDRPAMLAVLAKANQQAHRRMITRWAKDRHRLLAIARANAAKGTAALTGKRFSAARRAAHSAALTGRKLGGQMTQGDPANIRARPYALVDPDGNVHQGSNLLAFVVGHPDLFAPEDLAPQGPTNRAYKSLHRVERGGRKSWKGWTKWTT